MGAVATGRPLRTDWNDNDETERSESDQGTVVAVIKGQTTGHVRIDVGGGIEITSSITNETIDELELKVGDTAIAVIKASDVMVAK